jgi:hypothetical protein
MPHPLSRGRRPAGDERRHRLRDVRLHVGRRLLLGTAAEPHSHVWPEPEFRPTFPTIRVQSVLVRIGCCAADRRIGELLCGEIGLPPRLEWSYSAARHVPHDDDAGTAGAAPGFCAGIEYLRPPPPPPPVLTTALAPLFCPYAPPAPPPPVAVPAACPLALLPPPPPPA